MPALAALFPARAGALMPAVKHKKRQCGDSGIDCYSGECNEGKPREHPWDVQPVASLGDAESEPRPLACFAPRELGDDRADKRQAPADSQPAEKIRHGRWQTQI